MTMSYSLSEKHIVVNYHYVENPREDFSGINPTSIKTFEDQMEFLSNNYRFGTVPEVYRAARTESSERLCAITFDDGLKDQYKNAVPVLEKHRATATFFIISSTLESYIPSAHIIHLLLSKASAEKLIEVCNSFFKEEYPNHTGILIPKDKRITMERKLRDDIPTANFKETIYRLPKEREEKCLSHLLEHFSVNRKDAASAFFMDEEMIADLSRRDFSVECHGHHHYALDTQNGEAIRNDVRVSKKKLEEITDRPVTILSYPHGGFNRNIQEIIKQEGFTHGVTIERRGVEKADSPFAIPRYDTKDIVF